MGLLTADDSRDDGWEAMRCKNHPNLRWTRKSRAQQATAISRNIQLMFDGDITRPDAKVHPWLVSEKQLRELVARRNERDTDLDGFEPMDADAEVARHLAEGYVFECPCSYHDLEFVHPE